MPVPVLFHPACQRHHPGPGHPERPERVVAVLEALRAADMASTVEWCEARPATREALERVHPAHYLDGLERLALQGGGVLDADTAMSSASWDAAVAAAGGAPDAVGRGIATGSPFGAPPPPRHHALAARAMGVCLINNGGVAARPAAGIRRVRLAQRRPARRLHARARGHSALDRAVA